MNLLYVALAGALGSASRHLVSSVAQERGAGFPVGTLSVNLLGCLLMGLVVGALSVRGLLDTPWRASICVGFLGGFTTYSSFALDGVGLLQDERWSALVGYIGLSLGAGFGLLAIGLQVGKRL